MRFESEESIPPDEKPIPYDDELLSVESSSEKTRYFQDFVLHLFSVAKILQQGGVLGSQNKEWRNVAEHCLSVAVAADILAEALGADRESVKIAALLHDWFKRREKETIARLGPAEGYRQAKIEEITQLRNIHNNRVSEKIIRLAHANIPDTAVPDDLANRTLEEKILHFVDHITEHSEWVQFSDRMTRQLDSSSAVAWSETFREQHGGRSLFEVQLEVAASEQAEFENILNLKPGTIINFMRGILNNRITEYADEQFEARNEDG